MPLRLMAMAYTIPGTFPTWAITPVVPWKYLTAMDNGCFIQTGTGSCGMALWADNRCQWLPTIM